ncbi:MAG: leucine-rich repeat domain-containing protein [Candidatus Lokiarchaeota archaeon]
MTEKQFVKYNGKQIQVINGSLDLRNNGIKDVNDIEGINNLKSIQELYLDNNQLITLPNWIENFTSLLKLNLKGNEIKIFPKCIVDLESLQVLQMDNNQLESLPESIGNLSTLQILSLSNNKLNSLPEAIGKLTSLQELRLTNNQLTNLPKSIINLSLKMKILQVLKTTRAENEVIEILQEWIALIPDAWEDYKEKVWKSFNILYVDKYKTLHQDILDALFLADALINYGKRQHNKMISCYGLDIKATIISRGYEKIFWETAKEMFNNIIKVSPDYCSINYYEMVCAKLNILNLEDQPIIPSKYYSDIFEFLEIEPIIEPMIL